MCDLCKAKLGKNKPPAQETAGEVWRPLLLLLLLQTTTITIFTTITTTTITITLLLQQQQQLLQQLQNTVIIEPRRTVLRCYRQVAGRLRVC